MYLSKSVEKYIFPSCKMYLIMAMITMTGRCGTNKAVVLSIECKATPPIVSQLQISTIYKMKYSNIGNTV